MATEQDLLYTRWKLAEGVVWRLLEAGKLRTDEYRQANAIAEERYEEYLGLKPVTLPVPYDIQGWQPNRGPSVA
jgi:hypothetical protein